MTPALSIIIPTYNNASFLERCIGSIIPVTQSLEIIIVDDGSTDNTSEVLARINVPELKIVTKPNGGVSSARNEGVKAANGRYVMYIDADDRLLPGAMDVLMNRIDELNADIIILKSFNGTEECYPWGHYFSEEESYSGSELIAKEYSRGSVWGCLYSRSFLKDNAISFDERLSMAEDSVYFASAQSVAKNICFLDIPFYEVIPREGSASRNIDSTFLERYGKALTAARERISDRQISDITILHLLMGIVNVAAKAGYSASDVRRICPVDAVLPLSVSSFGRLKWLVRILNHSFSLFFAIKKWKDKIVASDSNSKPTKIFCPIREDLVDAPGHLLFGFNYFEKVSQGEVLPIVYPFKQDNYGNKVTLKLNVKIAWKALTTKHDALYYGPDPKNLILLGILKRMGIYRKPMFCWKYTVIEKGSSFFSNIILKLYYNAFNKIFMVTENHVPQTYEQGIVKAGKLEYMEWGEDLAYIDRIKTEKESVFTFISTGKAHRDYETILKAFRNVKNARLKLYISPNWGGLEVDMNKLNDYASDNVELFVVKEHLSYKDIYKDLLKSHCSLCICKPVNFGVGYTQVLDSLACGLPCILTWNKDNPIDVDEQKVGMTVPPQDETELAYAMQKMADDKDMVSQMSNCARKLVDEHYNIEHTAQRVLDSILNEIALPS